MSDPHDSSTANLKNNSFQGGWSRRFEGAEGHNHHFYFLFGSRKWNKGGGESSHDCQRTMSRVHVCKTQPNIKTSDWDSGRSLPSGFHQLLEDFEQVCGSKKVKDALPSRSFHLIPRHLNSTYSVKSCGEWLFRKMGMSASTDDPHTAHHNSSR